MATTEESEVGEQPEHEAPSDSEARRRAPRRVLVLKVPTRVLALAAEAFVVFLGVWSAFWLDGCRERQADEALREQIHEALRQDMRQAARDVESAAAWFETTFGEEFLDRLAAGERPLLKPIPIPSGPPDEGWNAILASGGLEVLDLELIRAVESALATSRWVTQAAQEYNEYVRTVLVPSLDETPDESLFYVDGSNELRGKYLWYYHSLVSIQRSFGELQREIAKVERAVKDARRR